MTVRESQPVTCYTAKIAPANSAWIINATNIANLVANLWNLSLKTLIMKHAFIYDKYVFFKIMLCYHFFT